MQDIHRGLSDNVPELRAFADRLTRGDRAFAEDLVQDTCVSALRGQAGFAPGTNLRAWLFTILKNRFRSTLRSAHVRLDAGDAALAQLTDGRASEHGALEGLALREAFAKLNDDHRDVIERAIFRGQSYETIAAAADCGVGTVKSRMSRARARLAELLDEAPEGDDGCDMSVR